MTVGVATRRRIATGRLRDARRTATVDTAELLDYAAQRLPSHMVPDTVMVLDTLPLSSVGKVDRAALPEPVFASGATEFVAPRDAAEQIVADMFAEVLGIERVGVFDSFFDLGGNSLSATRAAARLSGAFGVDVPLRTTVRGADHRGAGARNSAPPTRLAREPLVPQERPDRIPLSPAQARMWFLNQFDTSSPVYNIPLVVRMSGNLDVAAMHAAIADVLDRHESLRTVYPDSDSGPHQVVVPVETALPRLAPVDRRGERRRGAHRRRGGGRIRRHIRGSVPDHLAAQRTRRTHPGSRRSSHQHRRVLAGTARPPT